MQFYYSVNGSLRFCVRIYGYNIPWPTNNSKTSFTRKNLKTLSLWLKLVGGLLTIRSQVPRAVENWFSCWTRRMGYPDSPHHLHINSLDVEALASTHNPQVQFCTYKLSIFYSEINFCNYLYYVPLQYLILVIHTFI